MILCISNSAQLESILKIIALVGAALFFLWKAFTGWLIVNLEITIDIIRQTKVYEPGMDFLNITLNLQKGSTDALWLKNIAVRLKDTNNIDLIIFELISVDIYR